MEKVKKFLEVSESRKQYVLIVEHMITQIRTEIGNEEVLDKFSEVMNAVGVKIMDAIEKIYADLFSDEEIDELILLHSSPMAIRSRELQPKILEKIGLISSAIIDEEIEKAFADGKAEKPFVGE
ncbi:DUF2059 domain-containing protein [Candidatus Parcubacteria bacterium]|nr:DUF2059 domain-containing protein [Candidatus Parcubacteria bacterium]